MDFSNSFSRGAKSGEICCLPHEIKKTAFLLKFSNSCPPSDTHACVYEKVGATPSKIGEISSVLTPFSIVKFC